MTVDVYRGRKTTMQQQQQMFCLLVQCRIMLKYVDVDNVDLDQIAHRS